MRNNVKFFIKENKFTLLFFAVLLVIQSIVAAIYTFLNVKFANSYELYYYDSYFWMRASDYIEMSNFFLSIIVIFVGLFMIGSSCLGNFQKSRRYKTSMGDLKFIEYIANPVMIFITTFIVTIQYYTSSIINGLWSGEQYLGYGVNQHKKLSDFILSEVTHTMITVLFVGLIVYFGMLVLYKQLTLYTIKYKTVKYKIIYSIVHCFVGSMLLIGIVYFYVSILYFNERGFAYIGYYFEEFQHVNIVMQEGTYLTLLNIGFFASLVIIALLFYNKCKKLDCDEPSGKKGYALLVILVLISVIVPSKISKDIYTQELTELKKITGTESIISLYATNFSVKDYDKFDEKIESVLKEYNITDYTVTVDNLSIGNLQFNSTIYLEDIDEDVDVDVALVTYNYDDVSDIDIIKGSKPSNLTEIIIPTEFADYILLNSNNTEYEEIIGKYVQGSKVVGVYSSTQETTVVNTNTKNYYGVDDNTVFYIVYSNKSFDENSLKLANNPIMQNSDVFNYNGKEAYIDEDYNIENDEEYINDSSAFIRINVFNEDTDYKSYRYYSKFYNENEFDMQIMNIEDYNEWSYLYSYIITLSIFAVFTLGSVAYITSNKERRGRNV